ncbi:hypothetical protein, partial [Salmonella sp. s51228]|uniref:hypothetical protein n=1 Tax=Salmonella sp. s51228 TaxID=3159652 RepID=UPI00398106CF
MRNEKAFEKERIKIEGQLSSKEVTTLSNGMCAQIASYYRRAVQSNKGNIDAIIRAINAIPYHLGANNENAAEYHRFCPDNCKSWCAYK